MDFFFWLFGKSNLESVALHRPALASRLPRKPQKEITGKGILRVGEKDFLYFPARRVTPQRKTRGGGGGGAAAAVVVPIVVLQLPCRLRRLLCLTAQPIGISLIIRVCLPPLQRLD